MCGVTLPPPRAPGVVPDSLPGVNPGPADEGLPDLNPDRSGVGASLSTPLPSLGGVRLGKRGACGGVALMPQPKRSIGVCPADEGGARLAAPLVPAPAAAADAGVLAGTAGRLRATCRSAGWLGGRGGMAQLVRDVHGALLARLCVKRAQRHDACCIAHSSPALPLQGKSTAELCGGSQCPSCLPCCCSSCACCLLLPPRPHQPARQPVCHHHHHRWPPHCSPHPQGLPCPRLHHHPHHQLHMQAHASSRNVTNHARHTTVFQPNTPHHGRSPETCLDGLSVKITHMPAW